MLNKLGRKYTGTSVPRTGSCIIYRHESKYCVGFVHGLESGSALLAVSKLLTWSDLFAPPVPKSIADSPVVFWDSENEMGVRIPCKNVLRFSVPLKFSVPPEGKISGKTLYCFLCVFPSKNDLRFTSLEKHPLTFEKFFRIRKKVQSIRSLDLFSGAGLMSCGIDMVPNAESVAAVEIDHNACKTFRFNFPEAKLFEGDVKDFLEGKLIASGCELTSAEFLNDGYNINMVCGGSPCQPFSAMTPTNLRDVRIGPLNLFCDVVERVRPQLVVHENVPNFMNPSSPFSSPILTLVYRMVRLGYQFQVYNVCMAHHGVPQRRHRNFFLAATADTVLPEFPKAEFSYEKTTWPCFVYEFYSGTISDNGAEKRKRCPSASEATADLAKIKPAAAGTSWDKPVKYNAPKKRSMYQICSRKKRRLTDTQSKKVYNHVGNKISQTSLKQHKILDPDEPFCTILTAPTPFGAGTVNPLTRVPRVWTPREFLRAQGVPDWFVLTCGITAANRQVGNGVSSLFMSKLVQKIVM
jgi:DNA-cytosine methyltransferase